MKFALSLLTLLMPVAFAQADSAKYLTSCQAALAGTAGTKTVSAQSPEFEFDATTGNSGQTMARLDFGDYTIVADLANRQTPAKAESGAAMEPTILMQLFKGGNPVQGNITILFAQGLRLESWSVGQSQTLSSFNFLNIQSEGQYYSRLDYSCSLTRTR